MYISKEETLKKCRCIHVLGYPVTLKKMTEIETEIETETETETEIETETGGF